MYIHTSINHLMYTHILVLVPLPQVKHCALALANAQAFQDARVKEDDGIQQDIQDTFRELNMYVRRCLTAFVGVKRMYSICI